MATVITTDIPPISTAPNGDQRVVMTGVGWKGYLRVLRARGDRRRPKLVYLDGDLYLMSPSYSHELYAERLGDIVKEIGVGLGIPFVRARSTTFRNRHGRGGGEADASFYIANAGRVKDNTDFDLRRDPPPDLVIEAVNTHDADAAVEVWRRFCVPEVWVADANRVQILTLQDDGGYAQAATSRAFPFLSSANLFEWMTRSGGGGTEMDWVTELRRWVNQVLVPRVRGDLDRAGGA